MTTTQERALDMMVEMPREMLHPKDYLDHRYFYTRAYFLAVMAASLCASLADSVGFAYTLLHGNPLTPVLVVTPHSAAGASPEVEDRPDGRSRDASSASYSLRIIPCAPTDFFPLSKLRPSARLVRHSSAVDKSQSVSTPFYNSTLKAEGCYSAYLRVCRKAERNCPAFGDACIMGRTWLRQRGFGGSLSQGGFGNFEWAVTLATLLQCGGRNGQAALSSSLTAVQLFKAVIQFLSLTNLAEKNRVLGLQLDAPVPKEEGPVLYEPVSQLNIAFKMSPWSASLLFHHAQWTHALFSNSMVDHFTPAFITRADTPLHSYDMNICIQCGPATPVESAGSRGRAWDAGAKIYTVLRRGLADKAHLIHVKIPPESRWPLAEETPSHTGCQRIEVGVVYDPLNMLRKTDRGPLVEQKAEAEIFHQFWGDKSELRRFKDGVICETLLWEAESADGICEEMVRYLLQRHVQLGYIHDDLAFHGGCPGIVPIRATDSDLFRVARKEFAMFEQDLRDLEDLPLQIRQVRPICPELRLTSREPHSFSAGNQAPRPMEVVMFFEASGKWPENLQAIQRTKAAFLLKIGELLQSAKAGSVTTRIGLEESTSEGGNLAFLDVIYESSASFRLRVHSDLEESMLEKRIKDKTLDQHARTESARLLATFKRRFTILPLHTQTIYTCTTRFPALSGAVRLLRSWCEAHRLSAHFTPEFFELVCLRIFVAPFPWDVPASPTAAFLRTLLFLSKWDWRSEPLIVDTAGDMTPTDHAAIDTRMEAWRTLDPNMNQVVLFVATEQQANGTAYTTLHGQPKPPKVVASRLTALAKTATLLVKDSGIQLKPQVLFTPCSKDYDVLIHLNKKSVKRSLEIVALGSEAGEETGRSRCKNPDETLGPSPLPLVQHPVDLFLDRLQGIYADILVFFRGPETDPVVGAIWNPQAARRRFRVNLPGPYAPAVHRRGGDDDDDGSGDDVEYAQLNKGAVLAELARLGGDLVHRIETKVA